MNVDITTLKSGIEKIIDIDELIVIPNEYLKQTELIALKDVHIFGSLYLDSLDLYQISITIDGIMVLPCAVTLKPVEHHFEATIDGDVSRLLEEIDEKIKKSRNTIDILPIIWENILMEIPLRVVSEDAKDVNIVGNGWKLISDIENENQTNSALEKLKDLL